MQGTGSQVADDEKHTDRPHGEKHGHRTPFHHTINEESKEHTSNTETPKEAAHMIEKLKKGTTPAVKPPEKEKGPAN